MRLLIVKARTKALGPASALSLPDLGDKIPVMVCISIVITTKIIDKRLRPSGVEYKGGFEPIWLAAELAEATQMGLVRILDYETGLARAGRLRRLRKRKLLEQIGRRANKCV